MPWLSQAFPQPISAPVIPMRKALVRPTESADAVPPTSSSPFDFQTVGNPSTKTLPPVPTPNHHTRSPLSTICNCLQLLVSSPQWLSPPLLTPCCAFALASSCRPLPESPSPPASSSEVLLMPPSRLPSKAPLALPKTRP